MSTDDNGRVPSKLGRCNPLDLEARRQAALAELDALLAEDALLDASFEIRYGLKSRDVDSGFESRIAAALDPGLDS